MHTVNSTTLNEIICKCCKHNIQAQEQLFHLYAGRMMTLCLLYTKNEEIAQDTLQEGFIAVFKYLPTYKFEGNFEGWMRRVFTSVIIRYLQKEKRFNQCLELDKATQPLDESQDAIDNLSEQEIINLISSLPLGYRTVFNLYVLDGYTHAEIAKNLGIEEASSRSQLSKARHMLQNKLKNLWRSFDHYSNH